MVTLHDSRRPTQLQVQPAGAVAQVELLETDGGQVGPDAGDAAPELDPPRHRRVEDQVSTGSVAASSLAALPSAAPRPEAFDLGFGAWEAKVRELAGGLVSLVIDSDGGNSLAIREPNGVGCVYALEGGAVADVVTFQLIDASSWGCERDGRWDQENLTLSSAGDGDLAANLGGVAFTLHRVESVYQPPAMGASVSDRTVKAGQRVAVRTRGFTPGTPITVILSAPGVGWSSLRTVTADVSGSNTIQVRIPMRTRTGRGTIHVLGMGYNSVECQDACLGISIRIGADAAPPLPDTSALAASPMVAPGSDPALAFVTFAGLVAIVGGLQRRSRRDRPERPGSGGRPTT